MHRSKPAIEVSLKVVNVVGILDQKHGSTFVNVNGRKEKRCSIVPGMTCEEHFKIADYAFLNGFPSSDGQIFVNVWSHQGKRPGKPVQNPGSEGYIKIVEEALAKIDGPTISKPDYDAFKALLDASKAAQEKREIHKAIEILLKAAKNPIAKLAAIADERLREINEEGSLHVAEAERLVSENLPKSKETLKRVSKEYAPLECSKKAAEVLKRLTEKAK